MAAAATFDLLTKIDFPQHEFGPRENYSRNTKHKDICVLLAARPLKHTNYTGVASSST